MDCTIKLWEVRSGRCVRTLKDTNGIRCAVLSNNNRMVISGNQDDQIKTWEVARGRYLGTLAGRNSAICLSSDGRRALTGGDGLHLWDLESGDCLGNYSYPEALKNVRLSADGLYALSVSHNQTFRFFGLNSKEWLQRFDGDPGGINDSCLSANGRYALSGGSDHKLHLWQLDWELEDREPADWDEGARPYLDVFLTMHTSSGGLFRGSKTEWTEQDFQSLLYTLGCAGYGWLRTEGVRQKLADMVKKQK
jgi:WD40 repeat protein